MQVPAVVKRHPRTALLAVLLAGGLAVFGVLWFEPQKLLIEDRVDEAAPDAQALPEAMAPADQGVAEPADSQTLATGRFISLEHQSSGRAVVLELAGGKRFLRFEGFSTSNGPDLLVYLSAKKPAGPDDWRGYDADFVSLGELKGNVGDQNYAIPAHVDLERYSTAVVWCRRFEVGFSAAVLKR